MIERAGQKTRPDGIETNLDGVGVHHTVILPSSWDGNSIGIRLMVDGPDDQAHVAMYAIPGAMDVGAILSSKCAPQLRELARMFSAAADVLEGK